MSVLLSDIKFYASATVAEDDSTTALGGAIDTSKKFGFVDFNDTYQIVSSNTGDTTQTITTYYRDANGAIQNEVKTLNGQTVVTSATTLGRIMKAVKSATCAGDVALESATAVRSNTAQGAGNGVNQIQLDAGASGSDGFYNGMIIRLTGGTGFHQIAQIIDYVGSSKTATINKTWGTQPDGTSTFRISKGVFFDKTPSEIMYVVRAEYNAAADTPLGSTRKYYQKGFIKHTDASGSGLSITACVVSEFADPSGDIAFALATALNDSGTNGGGNNRLVIPSSGVTSFDSANKNTPSGQVMAPGDRIGVWIELTLAPGAVGLNSYWQPAFTFQTT